MTEIVVEEREIADREDRRAFITDSNVSDEDVVGEIVARFDRDEIDEEDDLMAQVEALARVAQSKGEAESLAEQYAEASNLGGQSW